MDGEPPQEEDFTQIPLVERSQHKNWKARLSAYNDVIAKSAKTASDTDPFFRPYVSDGSLLKKWCLDANAVAQEKGIEAVLALLQYSGESSSRTRSDVVPGIVEKALGAARAGTKRKGMDLCAMYVEVENGGEGVMGDVLPGVDSKQPKVVAGSIACLKEMVESFGVQAMGNVKPLLKVLPKIFAHPDKNVRAEGTSLVLTLYTYLGPALLPALADLKPVQMTDLQKSFDALDGEHKGAGTGKPSRWTRKVQREREAASGAGASEETIEDDLEVAAPIDPRSLLDPVNVLSLFPSDLDERLSSSKWKDRLESLEECNKILSQPQNARIAETNLDAYGSLASTLGAKCKSDANVNVVIEAAKVIEGLAKGIGKPFGRFRGSIMAGALERLKERKANVVEALGKALDALFEVSTLSDIVEDVLTALKSKNPQVKEGALKFFHRSLCTTLNAPGKDQVKPIAEALVSLLSDSAEPVRTSAAECLGTMMKILGERAFNPFIEGVAELQMAKVKDAFGRAEIRYRGGAKPSGPNPAAGAIRKAPAVGPARPARPPSSPSIRPAASQPPSSPPIRSAAFRPPTSPPIRPAASIPSSPPIHSSSAASPPIKASGKFSVDELLDDAAPPARAPPARFSRPVTKPASAESSASSSPAKAPAPPAVARRPPPAAQPKSAAASKPSAPAKTGSSKTLAISPSEPVKFRFSSEDAAAQAADAIPADYHTKLADGAWKVRLEGAEELLRWIDEEGGAQKVDSEVMMRFLGKTPGWGEKNFQVSAKLYQLMASMAEKSPTFGRAAAALCIGNLSDKLGDMKLKKPAGDALSAFAEKTCLAFVLAQAYEPMQKQKAPKAQADALVWIRQQLIDFGIAGIPLRDLISFVKSALGSPNAQVRQSATQLLVTVKISVGADISGFLEDVNPQLLATINSEFDKASDQTPPEPTKSQADLKDTAAAPGKGGKGAGADALDDLIPRVDLDKLVNQTTVLADSKSDAWKVRKEAFESLNALLEVKSNSRLKPNMGEIGNVLKKAMADTNLSVKMLALGIVSKIATGMGPAFDKYTRLLTASIASVCADQKATTRSAALAALSAIVDAIGSMDSLYPGLGSALETNNPALRASVLGWLAEKVQADPPTRSADMTSLAGPVISCLEDRNGDVRKGAGAVLPFVVANAGFDYCMDQTSKLKPASKATIVPLITNARNAAAQSVPASKATAPSTAVPSKVVKTTAAPVAPGSPALGRVAKPTAAPARSLAMKALSSTAATRPPSSLSSGDDRPTAVARPRVPPTARQAAVPAVNSTASSRTLPFISSALEARTARVKKDSIRWHLEASPKLDLLDYLSQQMESTVSPELFSLLFSKDHRAEEDFMAALTQIAEFYEETASTAFEITEAELHGLQLANVDLAVKYAALKLLSNNTQMANRCLEVINHVVETLPKYNERFSDAEAKLFVPALIIKLGDSKFSAKLIPIFESLDKVIAGSQVVQLLVQYGLEDKTAGKTCKNESLQLIEKAYKKRGSILRTREDKGFYESIAKCIADSGTRNAALSVMASRISLLQLRGGSKTLESVVEAMPNASKDMLANRRATLAAARGGPALAKVATESVVPEASPARPKRQLGLPSPAVSRTPRAETAVTEDDLAAPSHSQQAVTSSPSAARSIPGPSGLPRPGVLQSRLQKPAEPLRSKASALQPLPRAPKPTNGSSRSEKIIALINDIRHDDMEHSVEALKEIQFLLNEEPEAFADNVNTLADALMDELDRAFTPPENLNDPQFFRLVKHIIQAVSGFSTEPRLMRRLSYDHLYTVVATLTLRLVQADALGGHVPELAKFMNMLLVQVLSTGERLLVFKAMFHLLMTLTKDFTIHKTQPNSEVAHNGDLILKCMWKRCKVLDDDLKSGRLSAGGLLAILDEFLQTVGPSEYRRRAAEGIALGDMPLRTVKTIIQKILIELMDAVYTRETNQEIYDILLAEFGNAASDTIVYTYVFRLAGHESNKKRAESPPLQTTTSSRPPSTMERPSSTISRTTSDEANVSPPAKPETEAEKLVRTLRTGNQIENLDALYTYIKSHPEQEAEVQAAISRTLSGPVALYVRRAIETRKAEENPSPARPEGTASPIRSPSRGESMVTSAGVGPAARALPRKSLGPRPSSIAVDRTKPIDDQLAHFKNFFAQNALKTSQNGNTTSPNGSPSIGDRAPEPLKERMVQERDLGVD
ncbi:armadillo-type protein [Naematelia encephala]|uniref:Armadillo-type protein n=1 Tax=Naematelia encephala TaxID=71784 RepID=A0A1Y2B4B8_9TREE|nr:armadillo-type protein [Naematelia encephala]